MRMLIVIGSPTFSVCGIAPLSSKSSSDCAGSHGVGAPAGRGRTSSETALPRALSTALEPSAL
jgi:hypothetical protein